MSARLRRQRHTVCARGWRLACVGERSAGSMCASSSDNEDGLQCGQGRKQREGYVCVLLALAGEGVEGALMGRMDGAVGAGAGLAGHLCAAGPPCAQSDRPLPDIAAGERRRSPGWHRARPSGGRARAAAGPQGRMLGPQQGRSRRHSQTQYPWMPAGAPMRAPLPLTGC